MKLKLDIIENNFIKYDNIKSKLIIGNNHLKENKYFYTIAIPTFKRPDYLIQAVDSCLAQENYLNEFQIIIVDNDPTPNSETEMKIRNKYINHANLYYYKNAENIGLYGNWNRCLELSQGTWVTILSDDDLLKSNFLFEMNKLIKEQKVNMIYSEYDYFGKLDFNKKNIDSSFYNQLTNNLIKNKLRKISLMDYFFNTFGFSSSGMIMRRDLALNIGGHDDTVYPASDYLFQAKYILNYGNVIHVKKILASYRKEENESLSISVCNLNPDIHYQIKLKMIPFLKLPKGLLQKNAVLMYLREMKDMLILYGHDFSSKISNNSEIQQLLRNKIMLVMVILFEKIVRKLKTLSYLV